MGQLLTAVPFKTSVSSDGRVASLQCLMRGNIPMKLLDEVQQGHLVVCGWLQFKYVITSGKKWISKKLANI